MGRAQCITEPMEIMRDDDNSGLIRPHTSSCDDHGAILTKMRDDEAGQGYDDAYADESERPTLPYPLEATGPVPQGPDDDRPTVPEDMMPLALLRRTEPKSRPRRTSMLLVAVCAVSLGGNAFAGIVASGTFTRWLGGIEARHGEALSALAPEALSPATPTSTPPKNASTLVVPQVVVQVAPDAAKARPLRSPYGAPRAALAPSTPMLARQEAPPVLPETPLLLPLPSPAPETASIVADPQDLLQAMRAATGQEAEGGPARGTTVLPARQLHPALGALTAALRAVQGDARACLGTEDTPRACTVVFGSNGTVQTVLVPGDDARAACLRGVLSKAKVDPFEEESYPARVTIRP